MSERDIERERGGGRGGGFLARLNARGLIG